MKIVQEPQFKQSIDIKRLALYNEAMDLFTLSRKLSNGNLQHSILNCPSEKELATSLSLFISHTALSLPMSIAEAAVTADYTKKLYFQKHIEERVEKISSLCKKLEVVYRNRCHSVQQLAKTARNLESGFKKWSLQLTLQN